MTDRRRSISVSTGARPGPTAVAIWHRGWASTNVISPKNSTPAPLRSATWSPRPGSTRRILFTRSALRSSLAARVRRTLRAGPHTVRSWPGRIRGPQRRSRRRPSDETTPPRLRCPGSGRRGPRRRICVASGKWAPGRSGRRRRAVRRDQSMTNGAENRGLQGPETGGWVGPPDLSRRPDRLVDLREHVDRVTGIEPVRPASKVSRAPKAAAELTSILGIALSMDAGRPRSAPEALTRAMSPAEQRADGCQTRPVRPRRLLLIRHATGRRRPGRPGAATDRGRRAPGRGARVLAGARRSGV
jgi:hypothetical protein